VPERISNGVKLRHYSIICINLPLKQTGTDTSLYLPDAIFIGTDATEHWTMSEFEGYARPTDGWEYTVKGRTLVPVTTQSGDNTNRYKKVIYSEYFLQTNSRRMDEGMVLPSEVI